MINWIVEAFVHIMEVTGAWFYAFLAFWLLWVLFIASASFLLKRPNLIERLEASNVSSLILFVPFAFFVTGTIFCGFICLSLMLAHLD